MSKLDPKTLAEFVMEFLEVASPQMKCIITTPDGDSDQIDADGNLKPIYLTVPDTLAMWMQLPDCSYTPMFCGWLLAKGIRLDQHTPADVDKAVCIALTGSEKNVMIDWIGDDYAPSKLN